jgi:hypothetical protein
MGNSTGVPQDVVVIVQGIVREIINPIIGVLFALALFYFLYGLTVFIVNAGDTAKREEAKSHMFWGLVGLFVMVSAWGIIGIAVGTFGFGGV